MARSGAEWHLKELRVFVFGLGEGPAQIRDRMPGVIQCTILRVMR